MNKISEKKFIQKIVPIYYPLKRILSNKNIENVAEQLEPQLTADQVFQAYRSTVFSCYSIDELQVFFSTDKKARSQTKLTNYSPLRKKIFSALVVAIENPEYTLVVLEEKITVDGILLTYTRAGIAKRARRPYRKVHFKFENGWKIESIESVNR